LLQSKGFKLDKAVLKLIDFGASCRFEAGAVLQSKVGTPYYIAPEVLACSYNELCDMWSAGVLMFFVLCGARPFNATTRQDLYIKIQKGAYNFKGQAWTCISEDARDLIRMLLETNLQKRYSADQALNHVWVKNQAPKAFDAPLQESIIKNLCEFQAMNNLKKSSLQMIAGHLDEHSINNLRITFEQLDTNQDGFLSVGEYREGLLQAGLVVTAPHLAELIEAVDMNHNDVIDYVEFLASALDARQYLQEDLCWSAFKVFDRNGDGKISVSELAAVLESDNVGKAMGSVAIQDVMNEVDINGDGEIDFKEFMAMMRTKASGAM